MDIMRKCGNKKKKIMETSEFLGAKWTGIEILICFLFWFERKRWVLRLSNKIDAIPLAYVQWSVDLREFWSVDAVFINLPVPVCISCIRIWLWMRHLLPDDFWLFVSFYQRDFLYAKICSRMYAKYLQNMHENEWKILNMHIINLCGYHQLVKYMYQILRIMFNTLV